MMLIRYLRLLRLLTTKSTLIKLKIIAWLLLLRKVLFRLRFFWFLRRKINFLRWNEFCVMHIYWNKTWLLLRLFLLSKLPCLISWFIRLSKLILPSHIELLLLWLLKWFLLWLLKLVLRLLKLLVWLLEGWLLKTLWWLNIDILLEWISKLLRLLLSKSLVSL